MASPLLLLILAGLALVSRKAPKPMTTASSQPPPIPPPPSLPPLPDLPPISLSACLDANLSAGERGYATRLLTMPAGQIIQEGLLGPMNELADWAALNGHPFLAGCLLAKGGAASVGRDIPLLP